MEFPSLSIEIQQQVPTIQLDLYFYPHDDTLLINHSIVRYHSIQSNPKVQLKTTLTLTGQNTPLQLTLVSPTGKIKTEIIHLWFKDYAQYYLEKNPKKKPPPPSTPVIAPAPSPLKIALNYWVGLGASVIQYTQTQIDPFKETPLLLKAGLGLSLTPRITLSGEAFFHPLALPFAPTSDQNKNSIQPWEAQFKITHSIPLSKQRWKLSNHLGLISTGTLSSDYGFSRASMLFLAPQLTYSWQEHQSLSLQVRGALFMNWLGFYSTQNYNWESDFQYFFTLWKTKLSLDLSYESSHLFIDVQTLNLSRTSVALSYYF